MKYITVIESYPQENGGANFIRPWGTLNFHLPMEGLSHGVFTIFHTFFGGGGFLYWGMEGVPPTLTKNYSSLPPKKVSPLDSPHQRFIPPTH